MKGILAVMSNTQLVVKIKPEKNYAGITFMISVSMKNFAYSERKGNRFFCFLNDKMTFMNQRTV